MAAVFVIEWAECQTILFYMSWQTGYLPFLTGHILFFIFSIYPLYQFPPSMFLPFALHPVTGLVLSDAKIDCQIGRAHV